MNGRNKLAGQRIAVLAADGFEQAELAAPVAALRAAGAEVDIVSLHGGRIRGMNMHEPGDLVSVDRTLVDASPRDYQGLLIPGGYISPDLLRQSAEARDFVRDFDLRGMPIATLGHGAWLLASAGLAPNRTLTSWPGVRDDMVNAGATWLDQEVVRDGNWLTARGPQDLAAFTRDMLQLYAGAPGSSGALRRRHSDPQREQPTAGPGQAMRWLATPSVGAMLGLALVGAGLVAANRSRGKAEDTSAPR
ncbi:type 1 glutamine amidotransferase domain-containing protein [Massilia horti]|uniref:DJ-1/PfpI/YhbO family deglycase/protease n=1 Tax=Massilia horti TaxID=2562153 RepID=A0A4Y9SX88_9BURK|nr:type 1 glutamine amidotransferase domain-containing protein [Massilia horti]TFW31032.1 DJ-1/PfpI/YhbO family deglycase/protease [Massilia horti]